MAEGVPKKRIATQRGVDPKTVRRQVALAQECGLRREPGEAGLTEELLVVLAEKRRPGFHAPEKRHQRFAKTVSRHLQARWTGALDASGGTDRD